MILFIAVWGLMLMFCGTLAAESGIPWDQLSKKEQKTLQSFSDR
jgi:hypothetical protein